jgi:hypothetical protein
MREKHLGLPTDLKSKSRQILKRPTPPTVNELIRGNRVEPMSDERKAGIAAAGVLARRYLAQAEADVAARKKTEAEAEQRIADSVWAAYLQRCKEAIG